MRSLAEANCRQLHHFFEQSVDNFPNNIALVCDNAFISYQELEFRANQFSHYLLQNNITRGSIVALLLDRSVDCYLSILSVLKVGATYVPIEIDYPDERVNAILSDLPFDAIVTTTNQQSQRSINWPKTILLDTIVSELSTFPTQRIRSPENDQDDENLSYIIYTSGSTGKPKGVEIPHKSICHYVSVASTLYNISSEDRIYQGFSLAFDASLEEIWMAFANGATLVACTSKEIRSGLDLIPFLDHHQITVLSTVPTLLTTLEGNLPTLRLIIVGGETCPPSLVKRWSRPGLRIINTYGPTEATVIATYADCHSDKEVTIGQALPGYDVVILNEHLEEVDDGQEGELCIGGLALARGYVNRPENTAEKFIHNPKNVTQRLYRTGDLVSKDSQGNLRFAGRIDDQIKLRGFRIELNEIETVIMNYPGIGQAVVSLQTLDQPCIVAYLLLNKNKHFDLEVFKKFLRTSLPDYMVPAVIEIIEAFPLLSSGKVNRKALPKPTQTQTKTAYKAPTTELEKDIAFVWENCLGTTRISTDADFFYELGGHSLHAAKIVSNLRKIHTMKNVSILDLYKNPTISQLAQKFAKIAAESTTEKQQPTREKYRVPQWKYLLCSVGQFFGITFQFALESWQLLATILCYNWLTAEYSVVSLELQIGFLTLFFSMPLIYLLCTVALKWLLIGRIKPGVYPLWGWYYFRWWLVQRLINNVYMAKYLVGSPLINLYFRMLGAKIGKNCHINTLFALTPDLLSIGDNTSIGTDSRLNGYLVEDGWLRIGRIDIGSNCYLGARSVVGMNSQIEDNAALDDVSMLIENSLVPQGQCYTGSPALPSKFPEDHVTRKKTSVEETSVIDNTLFGIAHYFGIMFVMIMYCLCLLPALSLISYFDIKNHYFITIFLGVPLGAILCLGLHYLSIICCKKLLMAKIIPGVYPLRSFYYLRHWVVIKMLENYDVLVLADTIYYPKFLRALGAKIGKGVEMGEVPFTVPDLITIEEGGFTASMVGFAWPKYYNGSVHFAPAIVRKKGFVGNLSLLPMNQTIGEGGLLGCLSTTPAENKAAKENSAWLGSPAVFLPNREIFAGFSEQETINPPKKLYCIRATIEFIRILIPSIFAFVGLFNMLYVLDVVLSTQSWELAALILPFVEMGIAILLVGCLAGLKWLLLGKLKPLVKPVWNIFIWKNDVIEYSYGYFAVPILVNKILGTPFLSWVVRAFGSNMGKRIFCDTAVFSEFDLINIGDDVCLNAESIIQTHLYEDRVFKVGTINVRAGCNVGVHSILLYNTLMEENSTLGSLSLLMKGERLPKNTQWLGIPAQSSLAFASEQLPSTITEVEEIEGAIVEIL